MRRIFTALALAAFSGCARAENYAPANMTGISSTRRAASHYGTVSPLQEVITRASEEFIENQNSDGSWGTNGNRQLTTAFCLISLLRQGESRESEKYGTAIAASHAWLMQYQPRTDPERVATAIALSDYITLHYCGHDPSHKAKAPTDQIEKLLACLKAISPQCGEMLRDLLSLSRLPDEIDRPMHGHGIRAPLDKYLAGEPDDSLSALDDYLLLYLRSLAHFHRGGKTWEEWNRQFAPMMVRIQEADGLFPSTPPDDRLAVTALSVMSLTVYYIFSPNFTAWPVKHPVEDEDITLGIK